MTELAKKVGDPRIGQELEEKLGRKLPPDDRPAPEKNLAQKPSGRAGSP
ncbi:MAG TPA: hypothetical protein VGY66_14360 [Gemmataceae bacterium]|nr:hypothetical protein [Gemmataceae bacterium]